MELKQCLLTNNDCYKKGTKITPKGIVVHSTGANNPYLKRYIQPDDGLIGKNTYDNDWNRSGINTCVHAFIGKDKNDLVRCYQTLPYNIAAWGVGTGTSGKSYNYDPQAHIQFEICEDGLTDQKYFNDAFNLAIDFCVYICEQFNLSPDSIVSHAEAYKKGFASNHSDPENWLKKFNKDMNWFRNEVELRLNSNRESVKELQVGDQVKIIGPYASSSTSLLAIHTKAKGQTRYITKIYNGRRYPYQIGNKGKTDSKNTTGFAKITSLQKI